MESHPPNKPKYQLFGDTHSPGIRIENWTIQCAKKNILNSEELEALSRDINMKKGPDMIFGNNFVKLEHSSGFSIEFNSHDALKTIDNSQAPPKVSISKEWLQSKQHTLESPEIKKNTPEYDWTYSPNYYGTITNKKEEGEFGKPIPTPLLINLEILKKPDPILYYGDIHLYEDEFDDNGISQLNVKVRVMPTCFFVLMRFWMRIDGVMFRMRETRIFHEFSSDYLLRDTRYKDANFKSVAQMLGSDPTKYNDPNLVGPLLSERNTVLEKITINKN